MDGSELPFSKWAGREKPNRGNDNYMPTVVPLLFRMAAADAMFDLRVDQLNRG
jgi:hypothetical protein